MPEPIVWYTDRSRITTDWVCPRKRYWGYHYKGRGIVKDNLALELFLGSSIHDGLAGIASQQLLNGTVDIDHIASVAQKNVYDVIMDHSEDYGDEAQEFALEQSTLVEGLLRGFHKHVWPQLMGQYPKIRTVEQEMTYGTEHMVFMSKPDLVVENEEGLWYIEYKSTGSKKPEWVNSWNTAVQLHSTIRAIEESLGQKVVGVIVQGLYKGYESYGKQSSPMCYCYRKEGNPPFTDTQIMYEYKAGFKRYGTWQLDGGVKKWIENMPDHVLADQFPQTPPIYIKDDLINAFFNQVAIREYEIQQSLQTIEKEDEDPEVKQRFLDGFFPQHFESCSPAYGRGCGFKQLCHGNVEEPLNQGWIVREPHHIPEAEQLARE